MHHQHALFAMSLLDLRGVGAKTAISVMRQSDWLPSTGEELAELTRSLRPQIKRLPEIDARQGVESMSAASAALSTCETEDIDLHTWLCDFYPARLRHIPDPPAVLFTRGPASQILEAKGIAIVGTRDPSPRGAALGREFARQCARSNVNVISGLAVGCDTAAHRGCLDNNGATIAVLAHGLDEIQPATKRELAAQILDQGGALVSEYPPRARARPGFFVARNRIQSGLADALFVVETSEDGGTMHTVRFAEKQGRRIACLVVDHPSPAPATTRGNTLLINRGVATPIGSRGEMDRFIEEVKQSAATGDEVSAKSQRTLFDESVD